MTKHTPGPWAAGESADGEYLVWSVSDPNTAIAAVLPGPCADANARLIAAAPDLLEELHKCALAIIDLLDSNDDFTRRQAVEAYTSAGEVIAKATGREATDGHEDQTD